ncbi:MAG TPA: hypothetical protein VI454_02610 [Verrucomicrobiae bacterium]|jgi:tetratricopeptide (TPR) repeat protein
MNPLTSIFSLFKKTANEPSEADQQWLDSYNAFQKGEQFFVKGQLQAALDCFDAAIERGFEEGGIYGSRGSCLQSLEFHLDAIDDFDRAIAVESEDSNLLYMRSISRGATGDLHGRISDLHEAIRLASAENASNSAYNAFAKDKGFEDGVIGMYRSDLLHANLDLEQQATDEKLRRECPGLNLGPDLISRRRADLRRRPEHE